MRKLSDHSGETLVETLLAILVMLLVMLFLSTSIVTAQKVNATGRHVDTSFTYGTTESENGTAAVKIGTDTISVDVVYYTDNDYVYYVTE